MDLRRGSAVDHALHVLRIALPGDVYAGRGVVELGDVLGGHVQVGGAEVLFQPLQSAGAGGFSPGGSGGRVRGMGTIQAFLASSKASATWAGVAFLAWAIRWTRST